VCSAFGFKAHDLTPGGAEVAVTNENGHEYVERMAAFMLREGVQRQFDVSQLLSFASFRFYKNLFASVDFCSHLAVRSSFMDLTHVLAFLVCRIAMHDSMV
jgi:hypothetical protein